MYRGCERTSVQSVKIAAFSSRLGQVTAPASGAGSAACERHQQAARKADDGPINGKASIGVQPTHAYN